MNSRQIIFWALLFFVAAASLMPGGRVAAQTLQLSKNADFSTNDGIFSFDDVLHAKVTAPQFNFFDIEKNEFRLKPAGGDDDDDIEGAFINNFNQTYVAHIPLSGLNRSHSLWEFRAELRDGDDHEFKTEITITIQDGPAVGDTLGLTACIDSVGSDFFVLSAKTIFVDNATLITENGLPLPFSALKKHWKVSVLAQQRLDGRFFAVTIAVLQRSTVGQVVESEGLIASIQDVVVTINDIRFVVTNTTELLDISGNPITLAAFKVGMKVEARGAFRSCNEVVATRIKIKEGVVGGDEIELTGTITAFIIDGAFPEFIAVNNTFFEVDVNTVVLGFAETDTISLADLHLGELVQIEGRTRSGGVVPLAERIKREDQNGEDIEIKGIILALGDSTLTVGGLLFHVVPTTFITDKQNHPIPFSALRTGLLVEVHANILADSTLIATRIEIEDEDGDEIELKGFIQALNDNSLTVSNILFLVDDSTEIIDQNGLPTSFSALRIGMFVEVRGDIQLDGSVRATRVKIEDFFQDEIEIRGAISAIGGDSLQVTGITFFVNSLTVITDQGGQPIGFNQLAVGMIVEIRAELQNGRWVASRIRVEDRIDAVVEIFGRIDTLRSDGFFMLGQRILVTNTTLFLNRDNQPITFAALHVADFVEVRAQLLPDSVLVALRVKLREDLGDEVELTGSIGLLSFTSISVSGVSFVVDAATLFFDHNGQPITIQDLHLGMVVEVKGRRQNTGALLAVRVTVEDRRSLVGVVSGVTANSVAVQGLSHVLTSTSEIYDEQNNRTSAESLRVGQQVQIVAQSNQSQVEVVTLRIAFSGTITGIGVDLPTAPKEFTLLQNYPNPFNPSTVIRFVLPQAGRARLAVYDILGRRIRTLVEDVRPAGEHSVTWDGRTDAGANVASGIYFYRLEANGLTQTRKLTLLH